MIELFRSETGTMSGKKNEWHGNKTFWRLASLAWIVLIAWQAWARWPTLPLDMSAADANTKNAFDTAVLSHTVRSAALAFIPPALGYGLWSLLFGKKGDKSGDGVEQRAGTAATGPARILLMRHAEKTGEKDDSHLSQAGTARALKLASYIPSQFGRPDVIMATAPSKHSIRPIETVTPLAAALGMTVHSDFADEDTAGLVDQLRSDPAFAGKTVVICWHHGKIPQLAAALGAPDGSYPNPWDETVFNTILEFRFNGAGPPDVKKVTEPF